LNTWVKERVVGSSPLAPTPVGGERGGRPAKRAKDGGQPNRTHPPTQGHEHNPARAGARREAPKTGAKGRARGRGAEAREGGRGARRTAPNTEHGRTPKNPPTHPGPRRRDGRDTPLAKTGQREAGRDGGRAGRDPETKGAHLASGALSATPITADSAGLVGNSSTLTAG
jgi:hypothetical protein